MNTPIEELKDRLRKALRIRNVSQQHLSDLTGIPKASISQYISGYAKPKQDRIYEIANALNINEAWLLGYDVDMEKSESNTSSYYLDPEVAELAQELHDNPGQRVLLDASRKLSKEDMEKVIQMVKIFTNND